MKFMKWSSIGVAFIAFVLLGCQKEEASVLDPTNDTIILEEGFIALQDFLASIRGQEFDQVDILRDRQEEFDVLADLEGAYLDAVAEGKLMAAGNVISVPADYATIQDAINNAADGDIIQVAAGTYPEGVISTNGLNSLRINASGVATVEGSFEVTGSQTLIRGFTVKPNSGMHGIVAPSAYPDINSNHRFINNTVDFVNNTTADARGIEVNGHNMCLIKNNTVSVKTVVDPMAPVNQASGIYCIGQGHIVTGNHITIVNTDMNSSFGIASGFGDGNIIKKNTVINSNDAGILMPYSNHDIRKNNCSNQLKDGVRTLFSDMVNISNNTFNNNGRYGVHLFITTTNSTVNNNKCLNNTTCDIFENDTGSGNTQNGNIADCIIGF